MADQTITAPFENMSPRELRQLVAVLHVWHEQIERVYQDARGHLQPILNQNELENDQTKSAVRIDGVERADGKPLAEITLAAGAPAVKVTDADEFAEWMAEWNPQAVETKVTVISAHQKAVLDNAVIVDGEAYRVDKDTGEQVKIPGVTVVPARKPGEATRFSMTFPRPPKGTDSALSDSRALIFEAIVDGRIGDMLAGLAPAPELPAIEAAPDTVVDAELVDDEGGEAAA